MTDKKAEQLTIAIVDSGMGGLSICADIANGFTEKSAFRCVDLIYFNAWPEQNRGYNRLPGQADRIRVFNSVLESVERLKPDMILIACNTLSILYPETPIAETIDIPVVGIIDFGVQMAFERMKSEPASRALILGTLTTVRSETHKNHLVDMGIEPERIVGQPCDQLATRIESGPQSEAVESMINGFLEEAANRFSGMDMKVFAVFCCTHFGYASPLFERKLKQYFGARAEILNPNTAMSDFVLNRFGKRELKNADLRVTVLSRIEWHEEKVNSIAGVLRQTSPETAEALIGYRQDPNLFEV